MYAVEAPVVGKVLTIKAYLKFSMMVLLFFKNFQKYCNWKQLKNFKQQSWKIKSFIKR